MSAKRLLTALLIGLGVLTIAWLCAQPYFVLGEIRHAAQVGDRDALTELVDFPQLRGSLQASLNAEMAKSAGGTFVDNPVAGPASLAGRAAVDSLVEAYVAPAGIAALTEGRRPDSTVTAASSGSSRSILVEQGYVRPSVFLATVESDSEGSSEITFVLQRRWPSWVLIDVNLPQGAAAEWRHRVRQPRPMEPRAAARSGQNSIGESRGQSAGRSGHYRDSIATTPFRGGLPGPNDYVYIDKLPEAISKVRPDFPEAARRSGVEGVVIIKALIGVDGLVKDAMIVQSVPLLDEAAMASVRQWTFKPALRGGVPVAVWVAVPVKFSVY